MKNHSSAPASLLLAALVLAACATTPVPSATAMEVPPDRLLSMVFDTAREGTTPVVVKRDSGAMGAACSTRIYLDGRPMADVRPVEKVTFHLVPGDYILSAQPNGICAGALQEVRASVRAGAPLTFRVGSGTNGEFIFVPTAF